MFTFMAGLIKIGAYHNKSFHQKDMNIYCTITLNPSPKPQHLIKFCI